jgi:glutathione-regulated potassium-efflux system ancillary protein KefC
MGWEPHAARQQALRFRQHSIELMKQLAPHREDENRFIAMSKQGRQQLEELWGREREGQAQRRQRAGWHADDAAPGGPNDGKEP